MSCDEADTADTVEMVEREKIIWDTPALNSNNRIVGSRAPGGGRSEMRAHEEDIKVRDFMLICFYDDQSAGKTAEQETEVGPCQGEDDRDEGE